MQLVAAVGSHIGKVRRNNEDNFCFDGMIMPERNSGCDVNVKTLSGEDVHLMGIFDGMGGHFRGECASYLAAVVANKYIERLPGCTDFQRLLAQYCMDANDAVCEASDGSMMGTTAALLCFHGNSCTACNVGDSPIFRLRRGTLEQISMEHTQRASYERTTGKVATPGTKFKLTQCIGIPKDEMIIEPHCTEEVLSTDDVFMICSDGLTDMLSHDEIKSILSGTDSPDEMVYTLMDRALEAGGRDNITVICICTRGEVPHLDRVKVFLQHKLNQILRLFNKERDHVCKN